MLRPSSLKVKDLINKKATEADFCKRYELYDKDVQDMLQNLYEALWRLNLYESQIIYVLNEAIRAFNIKE